MKKVKLILLLITAFILTGCEAHYNLTITETGMTESVDFITDNTPENKSLLQNYLKSNYMAFYNMNNRQSNQYDKEEINKDDSIGMRLSYTYLGDDLKKSSLLDRCYYKKSVIRTENEIVLSTDGKAMCFYKDENKLLDKLVVNITTDLKVTYNNADKVDGNKYTWIIDDTNFQNKPINMKIDLKETEEKSFMWKFILIIIGVIIIIGISFLIFMYSKNKRNNKL